MVTFGCNRSKEMLFFHVVGYTVGLIKIGVFIIREEDIREKDIE